MRKGSIMTFAFKIHHHLAFGKILKSKGQFKSETYKSKPAILSTLKKYYFIHITMQKRANQEKLYP